MSLQREDIKGGKKKEYKVVGWGIFALMLYIIDNIV